MGQGSVQHALTGLVDHLLEELEKEKNISVAELYQAFGRRTYGPFLFIIGLVALSPLGGLPGAGILSGMIITLIAAQYFFLQAPWLPQKILHLEISGEKVRSTLQKVRPYLEKFEWIIKPRLTFWTEYPFNMIAMAVVILMGILLILIALIPWAMTLPSFAVMLIGIALVTHDGFIMVIGQLISLLSIFSAFLFLFQ